MFDADRPILCSAQDRLGRATFAKYLARCILDHTSTESLVIGLYGGWGAGKTSIINLALEELRFAASNMFDEEKPIILNFSPWSYSGQNQLIYNFFRRLSSEIRRAPYLEDSEKIIHLLELYVSFFTNKPIPKSLRRKKLFSKKIDAFGWESGRDLTQVKAELNELLRQQKHKLIIIIDNISRLDAQEVKQVFQIVKSMGDYSNTIYLLALDKQQVVQELNKLQEESGIEYLEKVVQLPFEIPPISKQDLESILLSKLKPLIAELPEDSWNKEYWADIYYSGIKYLFNSCRDITRYINTVSFGFARIKELVNPVDFLTISAIGIFSPSVYYGIRDNKDLFTDLMDNVYDFDKRKLAEDKIRCDEIIHRPGKISHEILLELLIFLFPRLRHFYATHLPFYHSDQIARKNRRISSSDVFDIYFRLSMPTGYIPESEMSALLDLIHDEKGFALALLRLNQDEKITKFLDAFDGYGTKKINLEDIPKVIEALIDSGDLFPEGDNSPVSFDTAMRMHRILHQLFRRFDSHEVRFNVFRDAIIKATNSLYIIIHELKIQSMQHNENEDTFIPLEERDFFSDQIETLKHVTLGKIRQWADTNRLSEHPKLLPILYAWLEWGGAEDCKAFVAHLVEEEKGLLAFLIATLKVPIDQTISKLEKNPEWEKYLENISAFVSIDFVVPRVVSLFESDAFETLREREQLAVLMFLDLTHTPTIKVIPQTG